MYTPVDRLEAALGEAKGDDIVTVFLGDVKDCGGKVESGKRPGEELEMKASEVKALVTKNKPKAAPAADKKEEAK